MIPLLILLLFSGCSERGEEKDYLSFEGIAMTIPYRILLGHSLSEGEKKEVEELIREQFGSIDRIFNNWNPESEVSRLNRARAFEKVELSDDFMRFYELVDELVEITENRFDPSVGALTELWKSSLKRGELVEEESLARARASVGWQTLHREGNALWKENDLTALDFGGSAKGYGVDLLKEALLEKGFSNIYVEWGGEIAVEAEKLTRRPWRVGIAGSEIALPLSSGAVASSGNYLQMWPVAGKCYTHIVDPASGYPLEVTPGGLAATTVLAPSCLQADALATSLMLFEESEEALEWVERESLPIQVYLGIQR